MLTVDVVDELDDVLLLDVELVDVVTRSVVDVVTRDVVVVDCVVVVSAPDDTNSVTFEPFSAWLPGGGSVEITDPESTVSDGWL